LFFKKNPHPSLSCVYKSKSAPVPTVTNGNGTNSTSLNETLYQSPVVTSAQVLEHCWLYARKDV